MACGATLKRSYQWDPLHSPGRSPKRMCLPGELISPRRALVTADEMARSPSASQSDPVLYRGTPLLNPDVTGSVTLTSSPQTGTSWLGPVRQDHSSRVLWRRLSTSPKANETSSHVNNTSTSIPEERQITQTQATALCRVMLEEYETRCREIYEKILSDKLSEQYESFLQFNHELLRKRFTSSEASYWS